MAFDLGQKDSQGNLYLLSPKMDPALKDLIISEWKKLSLSDHVFIASSGTSNTNKIKTYALSFAALYSSADAVNRFLNITDKDVWFASLPHYHVGGLSIFIRALRSKISVQTYNEKWNAETFYNKLSQSEATLTSLVPTQLFDLLDKGYTSPQNLRGVFIGGDFLSSSLKEKALSLKWPIILTYGCTELCSQIASSFARDCEDGLLEILDIHDVYHKNEQYLISSPALFTLELTIDRQTNKVDVNYCSEEFCLPDNLFLNSNRLKPLGRIGDDVKVSGRLISFNEFRNVAERVFLDQRTWGLACIQLLRDERLGNKIVLVVEESIESKAQSLLEQLNLAFSGPVKIQDFFIVKEIEKTEIGKVKKKFT